MATFEDIINDYNRTVGNLDEEARSEDRSGNRAYGGVVRSQKGDLVVRIAKRLLEIAWDRLGGDPSRLDFQHNGITIPLKKEYLDRVRPREVADYIREHFDDYFYVYKADVYINIDHQLVGVIECKAYTENAMLKRILVDFTLAKQVFPNLKCILLQLESQLTGDYSDPLKAIPFGSSPTHTLLSYFDVDLRIITLLEGERKVERPIHDKRYFKAMKKEVLQKAVNTLEDLLAEFV